MTLPKGAIRRTYQDYLVPGEKYRVKQPFLDARRSVHRTGETWTYLAYLPSGFGEATAIFATDDSGKDCTFAIDWNSGANDLGLENLRDYIEEAT
jgi:hypothetical protein